MKYLKITRFIFAVAILAGLICVVNGCAKPPTASFTSDKTRAAVGEAIQFSDQSTGEVNSWSWDFGDGNTSTDKNPSHAYKEAGRFFVSLVVSNKAGRHFDRLAVTIAGQQMDTPLTDTPLSDTPQTGTPLTDSPITVNTGGLTISQIKMCSGPIEKDECRRKPNATYYTGDQVSVWFEITGFEVQGTGGKYEVWVEWRRYSLYAPDGRVIMTDSNVHEWHEFPPSVDDIAEFHGWWNIGQVETSDPLGEYRVEIEIGDKLSGEVVTKTTTFTLVKNDGTNKPSSPVTQDELVITLERTACFGKCPVYSLMIKGDGTVIYAGVEFVQTKGIKETTISLDAINQLLMEFEKADYFSLNDSYTKFGKSDMPSANTSISIGGQTKATKHYLGDLTAPKSLTELEDKIDEIVNSAQWIE